MQSDRYFLGELQPAAAYTDVNVPEAKRDIEMERRYRYLWVFNGGSTQQEYDEWCDERKWHGVPRPGFIEPKKEPDVVKPLRSFQDEEFRLKQAWDRRSRPSVSAPVERRVPTGFRRGKRALIAEALGQAQAKKDAESNGVDVVDASETVVLETVLAPLPVKEGISVSENVSKEVIAYKGTMPCPMCWYLNSLADDSIYPVKPQGVFLDNKQYRVQGFTVDLMVDNLKHEPLQVQIQTQYGGGETVTSGEKKVLLVSADKKNQSFALDADILNLPLFDPNTMVNTGLVYPGYLMSPLAKYELGITILPFEKGKEVDFSCRVRIKREVKYSQYVANSELSRAMIISEGSSCETVVMGFPFKNPLPLATLVPVGLKFLRLMSRAHRLYWHFVYQDVSQAKKSALILDGYVFSNSLQTHPLRSIVRPLNAPDVGGPTVQLNSFVFSELSPICHDLFSFPILRGQEYLGKKKVWEPPDDQKKRIRRALGNMPYNRTAVT